MENRRSIIQLATPKKIGAIHIIRISGPQSLVFLKSHVRTKTVFPRRVYFATFFDKKKIIDKLVFFYYKAPHSYTGEDLVELQVHGSLLIVDEILKLALREDLVLAEAGEFTERAFLNGKINLEMAEAIDSLVHTSSSYLKSNALKILEQKSSLKFSNLQKEILKIMAELESTIEFPEEDIPEIDKSKKDLYLSYQKKVKEIKNYFEIISKNYLVGKKNSEGIKIGFLGLPNAGKSTLLNLLLNEERVLVSSTPGTTRDFISENFTIDDFNLLLLDTAGIRKTQKKIEKKGIEKSLAILKVADIILILIDSTKAIDELLSEKFIREQKLTDKYFMIYINKEDTFSKKELENITKKIATKKKKLLNQLSLKKKPKKSKDKIINDLREVLKKEWTVKNENLALLNYRQYLIVTRLINKLEKIESQVKIKVNEEILIEEFRLLKDDFDELNLNIEQEEIFSTLFRQFCIGK